MSEGKETLDEVSSEKQVGGPYVGPLICRTNGHTLKYEAQYSLSLKRCQYLNHNNYMKYTQWVFRL